MTGTKQKQGVYTLRHQSGNLYMDDMGFVYGLTENWIFEIVKTAPPEKKSKFKRILDIIKEK